MQPIAAIGRDRDHIMRKLNLETRAQLVLYALANGLIGPMTRPGDPARAA